MLHAGSAVVSRSSTGPVGPRRDGLEVGAPDAGADGAAREGDGLRPQAVDVVVAIDSGSRVVDAGDKAEEARVVVAQFAAGVGGREEDVAALVVKVGDGLLVSVRFGLVPRLDGVALPLLQVADSADT